ncbi:MAG: phage tail spike protein, partial [Anaerorhabdus sp.]
MIQIYKQNNIDFESNGDIILLPYICYIDTATWELNLNHPIDDDGRWSYIIEDAVLKVPSFNGDQLFRIICKTKMDSGVEAIAKPIFFDSKDDCMLMDIRPTNKNGQQTLNILMEGTKYSGQSNITKISTAYYVTKNLMEALSSDDENSFLNRWGGE